MAEPSWHGVPRRVTLRYRPLGLTARMLDEWRRRDWLGGTREGSGHPYSWDDPEVDAQVRWLAELHRGGHKDLSYEDVAAGFDLRAAGAEYGIKVGGRWYIATSDDVGYAVAHGQPFTVARVPVSAPASTPSAATPPVAGGVNPGAERASA